MNLLIHLANELPPMCPVLKDRDRPTRYSMTVIRIRPFNPFPSAGKTLMNPLEVFLATFFNAWSYQVHIWWLILNIHCPHFDKKKEVESRQVNKVGQLTLTPKILVIEPCLRFLGANVKFQKLIRTPIPTKCVSRNSSVTWGQVNIVTSPL